MRSLTNQTSPQPGIPPAISPLAEAWVHRQRNGAGFAEFEVPSPSSADPFVVIELSSWGQVPYLLNRALQPSLKIGVSFPHGNDEAICAEQSAVEAFLVSYRDSPLRESLPILEQRISECPFSEVLRAPGLTLSAGQWIKAFGLKPVVAYPKIALPQEMQLDGRASVSSDLLPVYQPSLPWKGEKSNSLPRHLPSKTILKSETDRLPVLGTGGEGKVVRGSNGAAYKLYHETRAPAALLPNKTGAHKPSGTSETVEELTDKALRLPVWANCHVALPLSLISYEAQPNHVAGFEMRLVEDAVPFEKYRSPQFKKANKISMKQIGEKFLDLYDLLWELQQARIVVGDLKFDNVLVTAAGDLCLIDVDGIGVEGHPCTTFSRGYVDPRLCDPGNAEEMLIKPQDLEAMWYSYTVMLFEVLVGAHPFRSGIHEPQDGADEIPDESRALRGVWAFHPDVITREQTTDAFNKLPSGVQDLFEAVFDGGKRGRPRRDLIVKLCRGRAADRGRYAPHTRPPWSHKEPAASKPIRSNEAVANCLNGKTQILSVGMIDGDPMVFTARGYIDFCSSIKKQFGGHATVLGFLDWGKDIAVCEGQFDDERVKLDPSECWAWVRAGVDAYGVPVSRSPFCLPNIRVQGERVVFINRAGAVTSAFGTTSKRLGQIDGDVSLLSGPDFGIICRTENKNLSDIFLLSDRLIRLDGIPPVLGEISSLAASFSKMFGWVFIEAYPEGHPVGYTLVFNRRGVLVGFHAQQINKPTDWIGSRTTCAYDIHSTGGTPGLAAIGPEGEIQRITCENFTVKPYRETSAGQPGVPWILVADEERLFGVW